MSIISDALRKAADVKKATDVSKPADKRKDIVRLRKEGLGDSLRLPEWLDRDLSSDNIRKIAIRKRRWGILSSIGSILIVAFAVLAFLYNTEFLASFIHPANIYPVTAPRSVDFEEKAPLPPTPKKTAPESRQEMLIPVLELNGIIIEGTKEPLAVIDNNIVRVGDFVRGAQVKEITSNRATLLYRDKEITLRID